MIDWIREPLGRHDLFHDVIECLVAALEAKDVYTSGHASRVADMAYDLAKKIGMRGNRLDTIHIAGHLHDIGKIGIPDQVLNKKGRLLPHEWAQIQQHPEIGYNILRKSKRLDRMAKIVRFHHERWDGKGYPKGLKGESIPMGARIIAICDTVDAMTSLRSYREPFTWEYCKQEVAFNKGKQFDPVLVDAIGDLWGRWEKRYSTSDNKERYLL